MGNIIIKPLSLDIISNIARSCGNEDYGEIVETESRLSVLKQVVALYEEQELKYERNELDNFHYVIALENIFLQLKNDIALTL